MNAALRRRVGFALGLFTLCAASGAALAQSGIGQAQLTPPTMNPPKDPDSEFGAMFVGVLIIGLVVGVNLIPSKRGHKD